MASSSSNLVEEFDLSEFTLTEQEKEEALKMSPEEWVHEKMLKNLEESSKEELIQIIQDQGKIIHKKSQQEKERQKKFNDFLNESSLDVFDWDLMKYHFDWDIKEGECNKPHTLAVFNNTFPRIPSEKPFKFSMDFVNWTGNLRNQQYSYFDFNRKLNIRVSRLAINSYLVCLKRNNPENKERFHLPNELFRILLSFVSFRMLGETQYEEHMFQ
jgi:hypothetical protein